MRSSRGSRNWNPVIHRPDERDCSTGPSARSCFRHAGDCNPAGPGVFLSKFHILSIAIPISIWICPTP